MLVWGLVFTVLGLAALWAWSEMQGGSDLSGRLPAPPDSLAIPLPDTVETNVGELTTLDAAINDQEGRRYFGMGRYDLAYEQFARAVQIAPEVPEYHRNLGLALYQLGDFVEAEREFARAIQLAPTLADAFVNRSRAQLALGDTAAAITSLEEYLDRETDPIQRGRAERDLLDLRRSREPGVPLLGEAVDTPARAPAPAPSTPPPAGDSLAPAPTPAPTAPQS